MNHSVNVIKTSPASASTTPTQVSAPATAPSAFASASNRKLLLNQTVDNVNRATEGDLILSVAGATTPTNSTTVAAAPTTTTVQASTTISSAIDSIQTSIPVASTAQFPSSGTIQINSEQMVYSSTTATTFDNVSRGANGTSTANHTLASVVSPLYAVDSSQTSINVASTAGFATSGTIQIDNEQIDYGSITATSFGGLTRGVNGTTASTHGSSITITQINTITSTQTSIPVVSTAGFPTSGTIQIGAEQIAYTSTTVTSFGGLTRGFNGSVAAVHTASNTVLEIDVNASSTELATVANPISYILITSATAFYFRYTTKDAVVSPILKSATFAYHNSANPITNITFWNGTLQPDVTPNPTSFTIKQSSVESTITYIGAS